MPEPEATDDPLVVVVVRSGGIAGLSTQWRAEPEADSAPHWRDLVESCPWDAPTTSRARGADRFQWRIEVLEGGSAVHRAQLSDGQIEGPWQVLVDEVRRSARPQPRRR